MVRMKLCCNIPCYKEVTIVCTEISSYASTWRQIFPQMLHVVEYKKHIKFIKQKGAYMLHLVLVIMSVECIRVRLFEFIYQDLVWSRASVWTLICCMCWYHINIYGNDIMYDSYSIWQLHCTCYLLSSSLPHSGGFLKCPHNNIETSPGIPLFRITQQCNRDDN